jgi:hypothetical protein
MNILGTAVSQIDWTFVERLVADQVPESVTHDYKSKP